MTDAALREIGQLPELKELNLSYDKITGEGLSLVKNATLKKLNLEKTELSENFPLNLRLLETLKKLNLLDTSIARKIGYNDHADTSTEAAPQLRFPYTSIWFNRNRDWDQSLNFLAMTRREEDQITVPVDQQVDKSKVLVTCRVYSHEDINVPIGADFRVDIFEKKPSSLAGCKRVAKGMRVEYGGVPAAQTKEQFKRYIRETTFRCTRRFRDSFLPAFSNLSMR